jgi:hypothetical protein
MLVLLKAGTAVVASLNGDTDWLVEAGDETVTEEAVDMAMVAVVVVVGAALEVVGFNVGCKPPAAGYAFSFTPFEKSNLKPPNELAVLLLLVAVFKLKRLLVAVAGFIPKFNVPLESVVDGSSLLAETKRLTAAGVETPVAVDTAGEHKRPTFVWPLLPLSTDSVTACEVTAADVQLIVFTEEVIVVFPKVNKLFVASVATGFG